MQTLLLAAGRSRRFWPLAEKSLVPICGKTLLEHQMDRLKQGGCKDVTVVGGNHNLEEIQRRFPSLPTIEQEQLDHGMQGALMSALPTLSAAKNGLFPPVLIAGGNDVIEPAAYKALIEAASKPGVDGAILARRVSRYFPGGYLTVEGNRVTGIVEKPGEGKEPSDLINIVAHIHNDPTALLKELQAVSNGNDDGYELALGNLFKQKNYVAVPYEGTWQAVKYPWHLLALLPLLLKNITKPMISKKASIHPTAVVEGNVIIEDGAKLLPNACVVGPCTIGKNSIVGNGALVRQSSVGDNCVVGFGSEVKGSVLMNKVWLHMTYIGDSVIGENVSTGAGTITGNLRFDEGEISSKCNDQAIPTGLNKFGAVIGGDCRLGIQIGMNPGVKIGGGSFVAGRSFLNEDIPDRSFVAVKDGILTVRPNKQSAPGVEQRKDFL